VDGVGRAAGFADALGWRGVESADGVIACDLLDQVLGLYPREKLAEDIGLPVARLAGAGVTLSHNVREKAEVARLFERAVAAGADPLRAPGDVFWGGYIAYFADLDGHIWELAHNPFSPLGLRGAFQWNGAA